MELGSRSFFGGGFITKIFSKIQKNATTTLAYLEPVAPVAYQVILEAVLGQFREFQTRRVHTRINSLGLFLVDKLTCGKRESVS